MVGCVDLADSGSNRRPQRLLAVSRDITHRKQAEDALRESEQRYRTLFNQMDEGFCIIELIFEGHQAPGDWRFLEVNPAFPKLTGIPDAPGKRIREIAPNHEDYWFEIYAKVCRDGEPIRFVNKARELDGRWFDLYAFRMGGKGSRKVAVLFNNITERKQAEKAMRELRETESTLRLTQAALTREKAALADHVQQLQHMNEHLVLATLEARRFAEEVEKGRIRMAHLKLVEQLIARRPDLRLLCAADGLQGVEMARAYRPDLILMDLNLPGIGGIDALQRLREDPATATIPVVALTANATQADIRTGLEAGFYRYLTKPVKVNEFFSALDEGLALSLINQAVSGTLD